MPSSQSHAHDFGERLITRVMAHDDAPPNAPSCAICLDDFNDTRLACDLPCCGARARDSTVHFCIPCVSHLCARVRIRDVAARCPRCRAAIVARHDGSFALASCSRVCDVCRQPKATGLVCDACALGRRFTLRYACVRCGRTQRIPHPMWRYMATPRDASDVTWACHGVCQDFTHWVIDVDDVARVPTYDAPDSWSDAREAFFEELRAEMRAAPRGGVGRVYIRTTNWSVCAQRALVAVFVVFFGVMFAYYGGEVNFVEPHADARAAIRARRAARRVTFPSYGGRNMTGF